MTTRVPGTGAGGPQVVPALGAPRPPSGTTELDRAVSSEVVRLQASYCPDARSRLAPPAAAQVAGARERWVRAGALWWTLQRAREAQQRWQEALVWTYGSVRDDLALESGEALANSLAQKIPLEVRREAQLDLDAVVATFTQRCAEVLALPEAEQWRIGVHGKRAFAELLVQALHTTPMAARLELAEQIDCPPPIDELIALLLL